MRQVQCCGGRATPHHSHFWRLLCQDQPRWRNPYSLVGALFRGVSLYPKAGTSRAALSIRVISLLACSFLPTPRKQASSKPSGPHLKTTLLPFLTLSCADVGKGEPRHGQPLGITLQRLQLRDWALLPLSFSYAGLCRIVFVVFFFKGVCVC